MKITMVGTGYVGLASGACLAEVGNHVQCLDLDPSKIAILEGGDVVTTSDIDDLQQAVGFTPQTPLVEGIEKFVQWYKAYHV